MNGEKVMSTSQKAIIFSINGEEYGLKLDDVISVEFTQDIESNPNFPPYIKGIKRARGEMVPVIDLKEVFYDEKSDADEGNRLIIVRTNDLPMSLYVQEVKEMIDIPNHALKQVSLIDNHNKRFLSGVANINGRLIVIIDPSSFIGWLEGMEIVKNYIHEQKQNV